MPRRTSSRSPFGRRASSEETFVGRTDLIEQFGRWALAPADRPPPVVHYRGHGGQGKSALLRQLERWCIERDIPSVHIDLDSTRGTKLHDPVEGLQAIASGLAVTGMSSLRDAFPYPRFTLIRSFLETRRSGQKWEPAPGPLQDHCKKIVAIALAVLDGGAIGQVLELGGEAAARLLPSEAQRWFEETAGSKGWDLRALQRVDERDLVDVLPQALGADFEALFEKTVRGAMPGTGLRPVILMDTFEDLQQPDRFPRPDWFVEDLAGATDSVLLVIAGRKELNWETLTGDQAVREEAVGDFTKQECRSFVWQYFSRRYQTEPEAFLSDGFHDDLYSATHGFPLDVGLSCDLIAEMIGETPRKFSFAEFEGAVLNPEALSRDLKAQLSERHPRAASLLRSERRDVASRSLVTDLLLDRFLREAPEVDRDLIERACIPRYIDEDILQVVTSTESGGGRKMLERLIDCSFVDPVDSPTPLPRFMVHREVRERVLNNVQGRGWVEELHRDLAEYFDDLAEMIESQDGDFWEMGNESAQFHAQLEGLYHSAHSTPITAQRLIARLIDECSESRRMNQCRMICDMLTKHERQSDLRLCKAYCEAKLARITLQCDEQGVDYRDWGIAQIESALSSEASGTVSPLLPRSLLEIAMLQRDKQSFGEAMQGYQRAIEVAREDGDVEVLVESLLEMANTKFTDNSSFRSVELIDEAEQVARRQGYDGGLLLALLSRTMQLRDAQLYDEAIAVVTESLDVARSLGQRFFVLCFQGQLVQLQVLNGNLRAAEIEVERYQQLHCELDYLPITESIVLMRLRGYLERLRGDYESAERMFAECLKLEQKSTRSRWGVGKALFEIGKCHAALGRIPSALAHLRVAHRIWSTMGEMDTAKAAVELQRLQASHECTSESTGVIETALVAAHAPWLT